MEINQDPVHPIPATRHTDGCWAKVKRRLGKASVGEAAASCRGPSPLGDHEAVGNKRGEGESVVLRKAKCPQSRTFTNSCVADTVLGQLLGTGLPSAIAGQQFCLPQKRKNSEHGGARL